MAHTVLNSKVITLPAVLSLVVVFKVIHNELALKQLLVQ